MICELLNAIDVFINFRTSLLKARSKVFVCSSQLVELVSDCALELVEIFRSLAERRETEQSTYFINRIRSIRDDFGLRIVRRQFCLTLHILHLLVVNTPELFDLLVRLIWILSLQARFVQEHHLPLKHWDRKGLVDDHLLERHRRHRFQMLLSRWFQGRAQDTTRKVGLHLLSYLRCGVFLTASGAHLLSLQGRYSPIIHIGLLLCHHYYVVLFIIVKIPKSSNLNRREFQRRNGS